jgi:DNA primase
MNPVDQVRERADIVDIVSKHVELKRAGRNYKALCPFHTEKTPSFVVFPESQTWRCFGACSEGGDVFGFLMKKNGWDFGETLRTLAAQVGVELRPHTPDQIRRQEANTRLYDLLDAATLYFMHLLRSAPDAQVARDYVAKRALLPDTVERFQLGYALESWDNARDYLQGKGYSEDELLAAGLLVEKEESGRRYDRFRGRLMIPIRDLRGRVVGFGARTLEPEAVPKYLNTPQTDLFDKSRLLYGLDLAKKGIREKGQAIIVEGYMDVMQGHQAGHLNIIAQMGTALTEAQLRQIKRYTNRLILALDADAAGQQATLRGLDVARQTLDREVEIVFDPRGLVRHESRLQADIRIATLPGGFDPDRLMREDQAAWAKLITDARPVVEYIIDTVTTELDLADPKAKSGAVSRIMPLLRDVTNAVERDHYTQHLARRLGVDERTLTSMIAQPAPRPRSRSRRGTRSPSIVPLPPAPDWDEGPPAEKPLATRPGPSLPPQEAYCLNQLLCAPGVWRRADQTLQELGLRPIAPQDFADPQNRAIFSVLQTLDTAEELTIRLDESLHPRLHLIRTGQTADPRLPSEKVASHLAYTVLLMRREATRRAKKELDSTWADALELNDGSAIGAYGQQVLELEALRLKIDQALGVINDPLTNNHG